MEARCVRRSGEDIREPAYFPRSKLGSFERSVRTSVLLLKKGGTTRNTPRPFHQGTRGFFWFPAGTSGQHGAVGTSGRDGAGGRLCKHKPTDARDGKNQLPCGISADNHMKAKTKTESQSFAGNKKHAALSEQL